MVPESKPEGIPTILFEAGTAVAPYCKEYYGVGAASGTPPGGTNAAPVGGGGIISGAPIGPDPLGGGTLPPTGGA